MPLTFEESISNVPVPLLYANPLLPIKCALTSEAEGPVYVNAPVELLYEKLPSPPASVAETIPLKLAESTLNMPVPLL